MAKKSAIVELIDSSTWPRGVPIWPRLLPHVREKIEADLREVATVKATGHPIPATRALARFLNAEYNLELGHDLVGKWLGQVVNGKPIS